MQIKVDKYIIQTDNRNVWVEEESKNDKGKDVTERIAGYVPSFIWLEADIERNHRKMSKSIKHLYEEVSKVAEAQAEAYKEADRVKRMYKEPCRIEYKEYIIGCDDQASGNCTIHEKGTTDKGEYKETNLTGYCGNWEQVIRSFIDERIRDYNARTVDGLVKHIKQIQKEAREIAELIEDAM